MIRKPRRNTNDTRPRAGWTTGACAAAAAKAAYGALLGRGFGDTVTIELPKDRRPTFQLTLAERGEGWTRAAVVKDAGDDPDVTHGASVIATLRAGAPNSGLIFRAGDGVGTVTRPGLPIPPGEPAINPKPRQIIEANLRAVSDRPLDLEVEVSIPGGAALAEKTLNPRLGIVGGLSVLGTTGVVVPYSCSAWIQSIHRGIDVARATGMPHVAAATGRTSEETARRLYGLPLEATIDMGDFVGGMLKYLRRHPLPRVTIAGGFAKLAKLAQGHMDLHSSRSRLDLARLAALAGNLGAAEPLRNRIEAANTGAEALNLCAGEGVPIAAAVARGAREAALAGAGATAIDILMVGREGEVLASTDAARGRNP